MIPLVKTECRRETAAAKAYESLWTTFTIHTQLNPKCAFTIRTIVRDVLEDSI